jgi:GT2 family glycosyltransferase
MIIVVATQKSADEYWNSIPGKCWAKYANMYHNIKAKIVYNNPHGLPYVYNNIIGDLEEDIGYQYCFGDNICVFMHDDVEIHDLFFYDKLKKAHETYDIVGVAGATQQVYSKDRPTLWHLNCNKFMWGPGDGRGFISHSHGNYISSSFFGPTPAETVMVDGCFMSFNMKKVKETGLTFDEDFDFHHYDLSLAIRAKEKGLSIGVYPIYMIHHSPGLKSLDDPKWLESDRKFKEKYVK